jgi:hypothetical protein
MDDPNKRRCPHFQIYSEPLDMEGSVAYLAIRRCLFTERLIQLLEQSPDGKRLAEKLVIHGTDDRSFAYVGPDLEAVTQRSCSIERCTDCCTPAYRQHLKHFALQDPQAAEVACDDSSDAKEETQEAAEALSAVSVLTHYDT